MISREWLRATVEPRFWGGYTVTAYLRNGGVTRFKASAAEASRLMEQAALGGYRLRSLDSGSPMDQGPCILSWYIPKAQPK